MDGLSAAASVIAVIQISAQLFNLCRTYYLNVKDARKDIERLRAEITSFQDVLVNVVDLTNASNSASFQTLNILNEKDGPLQQCHVELASLVERLNAGDQASKMKPVIRTLKWPLTSKEVDKTLATIGRYKSSIILALSADQANISLAISRDVAGIADQMESQKLDGEREAIIRWLTIADPSINHHAACKKCQPETGQWFTTRGIYKDWLITPKSLIWLHGIPGCGKTILSSTIIRDLQTRYDKQPKHSIAYFYFDFNTDSKQEVSIMLSSLCAQLCTQMYKVPAYLLQAYRHYSMGTLQPSLVELKDIVFNLIEELDQAHIVIDALDECPKAGEREQLLAVIEEMMQGSADNLHILVTSRREPDIEEHLLPLLTSPVVALQGSDVDLDIQLHITHQLATDPKLKRWPNDIKSEIETTLLDGAHGMFRWVVCQLDTLKRCLKVSLIREALKNLPKTLDDTYARLFLEIDDAYREDARVAMQWLAFSARPLRLTELAEAIGINPQSDPPFDPDDRFPDPESVLYILSSLVTISSSVDNSQETNEMDDSQSTIIRLAHFSVKEYLISDRIQQSFVKDFAASDQLANYFLAECSLLYILHYANSTSRISALADLESFPLIEYASRYWYTHFKRSSTEDQKVLTNTALKLLLSERKRLMWLKVHNPTAARRKPFEDYSHRDAATPLFWASDMDLIPVVQKLLQSDVDINTGSKKNAPLHRAVFRENEKVLSLLLEAGADINSRNIKGLTALHFAAKTSPTILETLLDRGANIDAVDDDGATPLYLAVLGWHEDIAQFLIERGANVNLRTNASLQTPLHWAAWSESHTLLELLLEKGADINAQNSSGESALHYAARFDQSIFKQLLENGAEVNIETVSGETPLYWAASNGQKEVAVALIEKGAKPEGPILLNARRGFHSELHFLLAVGMAVPASKDETLGALKGASDRGYGLCIHCRALLGGDEDKFLQSPTKIGSLNRGLSYIQDGAANIPETYEQSPIIPGTRGMALRNHLAATSREKQEAL